jgi:hypothetical protein
LTWSERVKKAREAGIIAVQRKGEANLFWKESAAPVGPEQLYFEDEQEMVRRARLPECRTTPKGPLLKVAAEKAKQRVPMSFFTITSKARMGAKRFTRRIITLRVKAALNLIVTRGAYYGEESKKNSGWVEEPPAESPNSEIPPAGSAQPTMKFDDDEARSMGRKWILQGRFSVFSRFPITLHNPHRLVVCLRPNDRDVSNAVLETHPHLEESFDDPQSPSHRDGK